MVFTDRPLLAATSSGIAKTLAQSSYNKLISRTLGPFRVGSVKANTLTSDENGIHNTARIDPALPAPYRPQRNKILQLKTVKRNLATESTETECNKHQFPKKYTIGRIVDHKGIKADIRYKVRWYAYHPWDDIYDPASPRRQLYIHRFGKGKPGCDQRKKEVAPCSPKFHTFALERRVQGLCATFVFKANWKGLCSRVRQPTVLFHSCTSETKERLLSPVIMMPIFRRRIL